MIQTSAPTRPYGARTAVGDARFEVPSGRVTGFVGPNGAGKSTTLRSVDHPVQRRTRRWQ